MTQIRRACLPLLVLATLGPLTGCPAIDESPSRQTDLVISNSGWTGVEKVTVNGVDRGKLPPMGVIALQDVGEGHVRVEAFVRASDAAPCATFERDLHRGERIPFTIDCSAR